MSSTFLKCPACFKDSPNLNWDFEGDITAYFHYIKSIHKQRQSFMSNNTGHLMYIIESTYREGRSSLLCLWCRKYYKWHISDGSKKYTRHIVSFHHTPPSTIEEGNNE